MSLQVIGDPVLHSKSPALHGAMLSALGLKQQGRKLRKMVEKRKKRREVSKTAGKKHNKAY